MVKSVTVTIVLVLGAMLLSGAWAVQRSSNPATVVAAGGNIYQGQVKSLDEQALAVVLASGKTVTIKRSDVVFINFRPDSVAVKACGTEGGVFYDYGSGYALPIPQEGWTSSQDAEGHLFLHKGKFSVGVYAYLSRYSSLTVFTSVHAHWRQTQNMPRESYIGGVDMTVDGLPAQAFTFESTIQGKLARVMDVKTVGPAGNGYVITLMGQDVTKDEFQAAKQEAMPIIGRFRFLRVQS
jgi:hypothetical protein